MKRVVLVLMFVAGTIACGYGGCTAERELRNEMPDEGRIELPE